MTVAVGEDLNSLIGLISWSELDFNWNCATSVSVKFKLIICHRWHAKLSDLNVETLRVNEYERIIRWPRAICWHRSLGQFMLICLRCLLPTCYLLILHTPYRILFFNIITAIEIQNNHNFQFPEILLLLKMHFKSLPWVSFCGSVETATKTYVFRICERVIWCLWIDVALVL